jgi:hypothetical protein
VARWTLKVRIGPQVERSSFDELEAALDALDARLDELAETERRDDIQFFRRTISAERQVAVRAEIAGPGRIAPAVRGGVDLRGDGSTEAFTGQARRQLVEAQNGETGVDALRRALTGLASAG